MNTKNYYIAHEKYAGQKAGQEKITAKTPHMISYLCHIPGKVSITVTATNVQSQDAACF